MKKHNSPSNRSRCAFFTLIELLVVIAIIAILAAILMPALSSARERSRASACTNNLSNMGRALQMYSDDSGGYITPHNSGKRYLSYQMCKYLGVSIGGVFDPATVPLKPKVLDTATAEMVKPLICPSAVDHLKVTGNGIFMSYGHNGYAYSNLTAGDDAGPDGTYAVHMNQVKRPSQKFYLTDAARYTENIAGDAANKVINMDSYTIFQKQSWPFRPAGYVHVEFRHNARANWVYFDGHCGTKVLEEFLPNTATSPISVYRHMYPKSNTK